MDALREILRLCGLIHKDISVRPLIILHGFLGDTVPHLDNTLHVRAVLLQCLRFRDVALDPGVILLQAGDKFPHLVQQGLEHVRVLLGELLHKRAVRENIHHGVCHNLAGRLFIAHVPALVEGLLLFNQVVDVLALRLQRGEDKLPELIILSRVPFFNEMCELMGESPHHRVVAEAVHVLGAEQAAVDIHIDGVVLPLEAPLCRRVKPGLRVCL